MKKTCSLWISVCAILIGLPPFANSQITGGAVSGVVRNQNGDPVAGAKVAAVNSGTNQSRVTATGDDGAFRFPSLSVGGYEIKVEADGYAKAVRQVSLQVSQDARADFELAVAGANDKTNVVATAGPITETSNSVLGIVIDNKQIDELPINGRNFLQLGTLVSNVSATSSLKGGAEGGIQNGPFSVSGQRDRSLTFFVDGVDSNDSLSNSISAQVSLDSIQEFKLITNLGSAEYGHRSGGMLNILTKAGSNDFHWSGFEFFRNDVFNAKNYFEKTVDQPASSFRNNQFGATAGGPLVKDRIFWFANYEGQRLRAGSVQFASVPTEDQRLGIFRNPATGLNVQLPVDPVSARILDRFVPKPNAASVFGNYLANPTIRTRNDFGLFKLDSLLTGDDVLNVRYLVSDGETFNPIVFNVFGGGSSGSSNLPPTIPGFGIIETTRTHNLAVGYAHNFSTSTVNDLRVGYNRRFGYLDPEDTSVPFDLGFVGAVAPTGLFETSVPGITKIGNMSYYPIHTSQANWHMVDTLAHLAGRHSFKAGGDLRFLRQRISTGRTGGGVLTFTGVASRISPLADFVMGVPTIGVVFASPLASPMNESSIGLFVQDDFQATNRLVLNLGLRYELNTVLSSPNHSLTNFSLERGAFTPGVDTDTGLYRGDHNNFAPRVGFAWSVTSDGRTVVRGGYGVFYDAPLQTFAVAMNGNDLSNPRYLFSFATRAPGRLGSTYDPAAVRPSPAAALYGYDEGLRTPYAQHFNLNVQRELGRSVLVSAGYVGTKGTKLIRVRDLNQAVYIPGVGADGKPLSTAANLLFRRPTQLNRLTPFLADSIQQTETSASSIYHSLQATVTKRMTRGLSIVSAYTWSRSIDDATDPVGFTGDSGGPQNARDLRQERASSVFDTRHRFTIGYTYQLPFHGGGWVEGWSVVGIATAQSGQPFTAVLGFDASLTGSRAQRPNFVPGALIHKDGQLSYDPSLAKDPVTGVPLVLIPAPGQFGTLGRNTFTGPGYKNLDLSLIKETRLGEKLRVQGRFEVFNVFNTTNLALPLRQMNETLFGRSTKTQDVAGGVPGIGGGGPRVIQLGLKFVY